MQRYLVKQEQINNNIIIMNEDDSYHIGKVMRMNVGDKVLCSAGDMTYECVITDNNMKCVYLEIVNSYEEHTELPVHVVIAHGLVMKSKMEEVVEKLSLLGCHEYLFFPMERSNVKMIDEKIDKKLYRLEKIAKEASEVAHRTKILESKFLKSWNEFIKYSSKFDHLLYAYEETNSKDGSFKNILKKVLPNESILILIGPEGGISKKEVEDLNKNNFIPITLGPRILRTEVAPSYCMAAISYELEIEEGHEI